MRGGCYATTTTNTFYGHNNSRLRIYRAHMQAFDLSASGSAEAERDCGSSLTQAANCALVLHRSCAGSQGWASRCALQPNFVTPIPRSVPVPRPPAPRSAPLHRFSATPAHPHCSFQFSPAPLRQCSEYPELTVGKLITRFVVKM